MTEKTLKFKSGATMKLSHEKGSDLIKISSISAKGKINRAMYVHRNENMEKKGVPGKVGKFTGLRYKFYGEVFPDNFLILRENHKEINDFLDIAQENN